MSHLKKTILEKLSPVTLIGKLFFFTSINSNLVMRLLTINLGLSKIQYTIMQEIFWNS